MKRSAWWLPLLMGCALGAIYFLPKAGKTQESAVNMQLPESVGQWMFERQAASKQETETLSDDTKFAKSVCLRSRPGETNLYGNPVNDRIDLSVVLSGHDLNNSIHRPERCMPAQGHSIIHSGDMDLQIPNGRSFSTKRLLSIQSLKDVQTGQVTAELNCITYYFFVGHDQITNDHLERTLIDIKDRLVRGMDQRWAYVSVSMWYGKIPWSKIEMTEAETDKELGKFLADFSLSQINWEQVTR